MGLLSKYQYVTNREVNIEPKQYKKNRVRKPTPIIIKSESPVILAQYTEGVGEYITAHQLKDYRKRVFTLHLLPDVHILYSDFLNGAGYEDI